MNPPGSPFDGGQYAVPCAPFTMITANGVNVNEKMEKLAAEAAITKYGPLSADALANKAYQLLYAPVAPYPIPTGFEQLVNCQDWADAWIRIRAHVKGPVAPGVPPTTPYPKPKKPSGRYTKFFK